MENEMIKVFVKNSHKVRVPTSQLMNEKFSNLLEFVLMFN